MGDIGIGIVGCGGRMGQAVVKAVGEAPAVRVVGGTVRPGSPLIGEDVAATAGLAPTGIAISDDTPGLFSDADVVIDFSTPEGAREAAHLARETGTPLVSGTTGLDAAAQGTIDDAARAVAVLQAANFSLGVNLLLALARQAAAALDPTFDAEILEMHHHHKIDAPSGTALALGRAIAAGRGVDLDTVADRGRDGATGARERGHIGFAVLRGGDVAGEHSVIFAGPAERVELTHKATDRMIFARGAVRAATWLAGQPPGLYGMADVLGLAGE